MISRSSLGTPLLQVENLAVTFFTPRGTVHAVRDASLEVHRGEVMGCRRRVGMRQVDHCLRRHGLPAGHYTGRRQDTCSKAGMLRKWTRWNCAICGGNRIAMVYQDPATSLNPTMKVGAADP